MDYKITSKFIIENWFKILLLSVIVFKLKY